MKGMKQRIILFLVIFFGCIMCAIAVAFCGGIKFGTEEFGLVVALGMMTGGIAGAATASCMPGAFR